MGNQKNYMQEDLCIQEEKLLDLALEILEKSNAFEAYQFIVSQKGKLESCSSQLYNYLYCLGALAGLKAEALDWLKEAIEVKKYWYRPAVFEDSDLDSLRDDSIFQKCKKISEERYYRELEKAETICTWNSVKSRKLALVLHGNQQNINMCETYWKILTEKGYQVEYVQSKILDSYQLYRWDDDAPIQLNHMIEKIQWNEYDSRILCGFSAGCNEILKNIRYANLKCEGIIFQSPWIPIIETDMNEILNFIHDNSIWIKIICGKEDEDCYPLAERFVTEAKEKKIQLHVEWIEGLGHQYPDHFSEILNDMM